MPRTQHQSGKRPSDRALCGRLLRIILARDRWTFAPARPPIPAVPGAVFLARKGPRRIAFFFSDQPASALTRAFKSLCLTDDCRFDLFGVLVAPTMADCQRLRGVDQANNYPRAFFTSLEELREVAALAAPAEYAAIAPPVERRSFTAAEPEAAGGIVSFAAEVLANTPVGGSPSFHYRLAFRALSLPEVRPPQFVMMDTLPARVPFGGRRARQNDVSLLVDLAPRPLLKRPFGICRDFHPYFSRAYLQRLRLPPTLALTLHIVLPDHFDLLYKVLPNGLGTGLMTALKPRQKVHMLGPLGRPFDVRRLRVAGVEEVHVIGGGVGLAPLILLVESLAYYAFRVKVFLGIATLESLRYRDELAATFGEKSRDAYVYLDDLLAAGVKPANIFLACDAAPPPRVRGLPKENLFHGLVPEQYRRFLERTARPASLCHPERVAETTEILRGAQDDNQGAHHAIMAFTCGPNRMMEVMTDVTRAAGIPLQVLLEKRMGCGIGVCFSCVQKVRRRDGTEDYARICTEGPLFTADDILWKNDDSKSPSANCGCAVRC